MNIRIVDIAKQAGVHPSTVSRALNPDTRHMISADVVNEIETMARELGYSPNIAAKNLRLQKTKTIGLVFPAFRGMFYNTIFNDVLAGISDFLLETEYNFKIILLKHGSQNWARYNFKASEGVDGLVVTQWEYLFTEELNQEINIPSVFINDYKEGVNAYFVCSDTYNGGRVIADHLYSLGHREVVIMSGPDWSTDAIFRLNGFKDYYREKGIDISDANIVCADYWEDKAYDATDGLLASNPTATAVFCVNDEMAFGVLRRLKEKGISCPEEISVIGYDNRNRNRPSHPSLTSVQDPIYDMAAYGVEQLMQHLMSSRSGGQFKGYKKFPVELIQRESTSSNSI